MAKYRTVYCWDDLPAVLDMTLMCCIFKVSRQTIEKAISENEIPATKLFGKWRFDKETIKAIVTVSEN